jgi:hypothetical protein
MAGIRPNTPAGYGLHFLGGHIFGQQKSNSEYGPPNGAAPFADYNVSNNYVGTAPPTEGDAQIDAVRGWTSGVNRSYGDSEMKRDVLTVANTYGQRGAPLVIERIVLKTALNPATDAHFQILPIRQMADAELAGVRVQTFDMGFHMPEVAAEFVPPHYKDFRTSSFQKKPTRCNHGWRIGMDMAALAEGQRLEEMYAVGAANDFHMLAAITVTSELMSVNDQYADSRIREATGSLSMSEIVDKQRAYQGSANGGNIMAHPGMFGILNRYKGIEYLMSWARREMRSKGVDPTHILTVAGALEPEAYEEYRNDYSRRGSEGQQILRDGEEAIYGMVQRKFGGLTIVEEMIYEPENSSVDRMCLLVNNAQVGRFQLLTNCSYYKYREKMAATASAARGAGGVSTDAQYSLGGPRLNDLHFLNLSGAAFRDVITYDDLVANACCFDGSGRLDIMAYDELTMRYKQYAEGVLGMNITDEKTFLADPFMVYDRDQFRTVRIVGNMDIRHTDEKATRLIVDLACNSIASMVGHSTYQKIEKLMRFMDRNYKVAPDMRGDVEAFAVAAAWENVTDAYLRAADNAQPNSLGSTRGGLRLPRVGPIINSAGRESSRNMAFYSRRDGGRRVLCKVRMAMTANGPVLAGTGASSEAALSVSWANPHYVWLPSQLATGGAFNDATGEFTTDLPAGLSFPYNFGNPSADVFAASVRLATVPRNNPAGLTFPFYSTFSDMRGILATIQSSSDANGWANMRDFSETLRIVRDGVEAADEYARAIKKIFSPSNYKGASLDRNLWFRKETLAEYQRTGNDELDENTAFLQNALCGARAQLGILAPFTRSEGGANAIEADQTFRFGAYGEYNNVVVDFLAHRVAPVDVGYSAATGPTVPGIPSNARENVVDQNYAGLATLRFSVLPDMLAADDDDDDDGVNLFPGSSSSADTRRTLGAFGPSDIADATATAGFDFGVSPNQYLDDLTDYARGSAGQALVGGSKIYILWGNLLSKLQTSKFERLKKYYLDESTGAWADARAKWARVYGDDGVAGLRQVLNRLTNFYADRISDAQIENFLRSEPDANSRDLETKLDAFVISVQTLFATLEDYTGQDEDGNDIEPSDWSSDEFLERIYEQSVRYASETLDRRAAQAASRNVPASNSSVQGRELFNRFLDDTGRITAVVGTRLSVSPDYWREYDRMVREMLGGDAPVGVGASMSLLRPASSVDNGQFVGAPPVATRRAAGPQDGALQQRWRETYAANYEDIMRHGGACHGADHATVLFKVGPAYAGAGCYARSGRGRYRRHGGANYGSRYEDEAEDDYYGNVDRSGRKRERTVSNQALEAVQDALMPGVHVDETPNRHFNERLNILGEDCARMWNRRAPLYALLGSVPSAQLMINLHEHGISSPISLIVMEPFIDFRMNAMIIAQGGRNTGYLGYHLVAQSKGFDPESRFSTSHVSMWLMGLVQEPKNILQIPYASFAGLVRGGTMRLVRNMRSQAHDMSGRAIDWDPENPMARTADAFVAIGGGSLTKRDVGEAIPLAGATTNPEYRISGDCVMPHAYVPEIPENTQAFPSAIMLNFKAGFERLNAQCAESARTPQSIGDIRQYPPGTINTRWNGWLHQGLQWQADPFNLNKYDVIHHGAGVFAGIGPGDGPKLRGEPGVLSAPIGGQGLLVKTQ